MIGYRIKERLEIWRIGFGLSVEGRANWKRTRKTLSGAEYGRILPIVARYLTARKIKELENSGENLFPWKGAPGERENSLILPNPYAIGDMRALERMMGDEDLKRWLKIRDSLARIRDPALLELVRRYAVFRCPPRVRLVVVQRSAETH